MNLLNTPNDTDRIWELMHSIPDPEIPVISITDLGIVREIEKEDDLIRIKITPTYSGCPAMYAIEQDIKKVLKENGYDQIDIKMVYQPVWTTDWINDAAKERLRAYGIAPPEKSTSDKSVLVGESAKIVCPRCGSRATTLISQFGSTACKALYKCEDCLEPFDYFKCH